jgi:serine/threonine protein phosphatase PrpC
LGPVAAVSDGGRVRPRNEDAFTISSDGDYQAAIVCDGVATTEASGAAAAIAARVAMEEIRQRLTGDGSWTEILPAGIKAAQHALSQDFAGATTIVAALSGPGRIAVANVGDSRAYWIGRDGTGRVLTLDDSWVREAVAGGMPLEVALVSSRAHEITAWLGADAWTVEPHVAEYEPSGDGWLVLCSDGLWNYAEPAESIAGLLDGSGTNALGIAQKLLAFALEAGGADNITVSVTEVRAPSEDVENRTDDSRG